MQKALAIPPQLDNPKYFFKYSVKTAWRVMDRITVR
jgi:hypothetical protein